MRSIFPILMSVVIVGVSGCAAVRQADFLDPPMSEAKDGPFIERAIDSVASSEGTKPINVSKKSDQYTSGRAYSGTPDGVTLTQRSARRIVHLRGAESYLRGVLDRLLGAWPFSIPPIGVFIVNQEGFEAEATAGRDILITTGMIRDLESEDELAGVLAHEVSHIILNHHARAEQVADTKKTLNDAAQIAIWAYMVSETDWKKTGKMAYSGKLNFLDMKDELLEIGGVCLASTYFIEKIVDSSWSRQQEEEADLLGIDLMIKAGYNPAGAIQAMRRRVEYDGELKSIVDSRIASGDYRQMVDKSIEEGGVVGFFTGAARAVTAGVTDTLSDIDNSISRRHELSEDRLKAMQLYLERHYPDRQRTALQKRRFQSVFRSQHNQAVLKNLKKAFLSHSALRSGNMEEAYNLALASTRPPTTGAVAPRMAMYKVLSAQNKEGQAFEQLLKIRDLDKAPPQVFDALADGYSRKGRVALAEEMKKRADQKRKSIYDKDGEKGLGFFGIFRVEKGANRFDVSGYCEGLRDMTSKFARGLREG